MKARLRVEGRVIECGKIWNSILLKRVSGHWDVMQCMKHVCDKLVFI